MGSLRFLSARPAIIPALLALLVQFSFVAIAAASEPRASRVEPIGADPASSDATALLGDYAQVGRYVRGVVGATACPDRPIPLVVGGDLAGPCWSVRKLEFLPSPATVIGPPTVRIWLHDMSPCLGMVCPLIPKPWVRDTVLPALPRGEYRLHVQLAYTACFEETVPDSVRDFFYPFTVSATCPPGDLLAYIDRIQIGTPLCDTCPAVVCREQPFTITLSGTLPDNCVEFRGVWVRPSLDSRPIALPPTIVARFAVNDCLGMPCVLRPTTWSATVPMPAWTWSDDPPVLNFESDLVSMCDSTMVVSVEDLFRPVLFQTNCVPPPPALCLRHDWGPPSGSLCNATFVNDTASVNLRIASPVALAGLQGVLHVQPGLEVRGLHPTGPAGGMTLEWTKTPGGAAFVMFAAGGAPIPPFAQAGDDTAYNISPVLHVEVKAVPYPSIPENPPVTVFALWADSLLGADSLGHGVPMCMLRCLDNMTRQCAPIARFCVPTRCDVNDDGHSDVRDLVLMVRCLLVGSDCTDPGTRFDCDGDGQFTIQDVLCCALAMLRGYEHGGGGRPEPSVALGFGDPVRDGDEIELPFTLNGADRVGAARVALRFPSDRYDVESFETVGNPPGWLALHDVQGGELVIGLISTAPAQARSALPYSLPLSLRLRLRAGAAPGGQVVAQDADVSGADGVTLATSITGSGAVLDPSSAIALSALGPNPAPGTARFSLSLPRAMDVDLAAYDLAGRRVATLQRGALAAGVHPIAWNGRTDRGDTAHDGVYFVRLRAGGTEIARKTVLVRGR
jgi:hypothetical protein